MAEGGGDSGAPRRSAAPPGRAPPPVPSSRPRAVAPAYLSAEADPNMPAVIVSAHDTMPSAPPRNMTAPIGAAPHTVPLGVGNGYAAPIHGGPPGPISGAPPSLPPVPPSSRSAPAPTPLYPPTPVPPFLLQGAPRAHVAHPTMRMADAPRRPRTPTVVLREQGPSTAQKLAAFMAMLVFVTACGISVIVWRRPAWLGLVPPERAAPVAPVAPGTNAPGPSVAPAKAR
jgi:hypothetical protein